MFIVEWHGQDYLHLKWHVVCSGLATPDLTGHTELGVRMDRACAMLESITEEQYNKTAPSTKTILAILAKFHRTGSVVRQRKRTTGRPRTVITNKINEQFQQVLQSPKRGLRRTSVKLSVSDRSVRRMFKELGGFTYRIQVAQRLTETD